VKKECIYVDDSPKCHRCLKGKKGCKFPEAKGEEEEEKEEEEEEEEEVVEEVKAVSKSPVAKLKKLLSSPLRSLKKRKEDDLSPESQKDKIASSSVAVRARRESPSPELVEDAASIMPPPSTRSAFSMPSSIMSSRSRGSASSRLFRPSDDFQVQMLQLALRDSEEDLTVARDRFTSMEAMYLSRIDTLEKSLTEGSSKGRK
jgi:hypothetical protein